ncbi:phosphoserine phosphatase SerB [Ornithinimicrobium sp. W1679]|uniref:phosphoserine phosphatase SerB n=1 Tax=Ornithinimicrobium sp. W1679 TaxID=3418770 RepID=UPI003CEFF9FC
MPVLTLLTDPARADLPADAAARLPTAWGAGEPRWLSPGTAVQVPLAGTVRTEEQAELRELWSRRGVDAVVQPRVLRRRVLVADMDSTMVQQECIDELAAHAGVGEQVSAITAAAMNGELDFAAALRARVALLAGLPTSVVDTVLAERITLTPGARELVATMRAHGARTALVSGGFVPFTAAVAARVGFDEHRANVLLEQDGAFTGTVQEPVVGREAKVAALEEITAALGLTPRDAMAVGDGANDLDMLRRAGTGVALHAKPVVADQCDVRVDHGDLTALLYLQGYVEEEFVGR